MSSFDTMELKFKTLAIIAAITICSVRSNEHIVRLANSSFNVQCVGEGYLTWNFQPEHLVNNFKELLHFNESISVRGERTNRGRAIVYYKPQRFELKINNSQIEDTGTYLCYENGVLKSSTHVYINDGTCDNLFVPLNESARNLAVHFGQDFVIPCRTTKPDVSVVLEDPQGIDQTIYDYNPTKGYLLKNASLHDHKGFWTCKASYPECEGTDEQVFLVELIESDVIKPEILDVSPKIIQVGDTSYITCRIISIITQETRGKLQWMNPNKDIITSFGRFGIQESENRGGRDIDPYILTSALSINNVTGSDEGEYICFIKGHQNWNTSIKLEVLDEKRTIRLEIEETARIFITNETDLENTDVIKWAVSHYPSDVHFKWFNTKGGEIKKSSKYKMYNAVTNKKQKIFTIQDPTLEDSGVYKVVAFTKYASEELNLTLLINSKPRVKIVSGVDFYRPGSTYKLDCQNSAYPPANFSWDFKCLEKNKTIDCEKFQHLGQDRLLLKNQPRTAAKSGELVMTTNTTGILSCKACNMMGCTETQSVIVVTDIDDGSVIKSSHKRIYEGDDVSFACFVPKHPCGRRWEWTFQYNLSVPATILLTGPNLKIANSQNQYSYSSEVKMKGISGRQNGTYICKAVCVNGKGDTLTQKYALTARIRSQLYTEHLVNSRFNLQCVGNGKLSWKFHPEHLANNFKDLLQSNDSISERGERTYRGTTVVYYNPQRCVLQIDNSQIEDTGSYFCYENGVLKNSTHVYINDGKCHNLFVPSPKELQDKNLEVRLGQDFVIPCRTTRPDVSVVLVNPQKIEQTHNNYNPAEGFMLKNASLAVRGFWICKASHPECEHTPTLINVQGFLVELTKPNGEKWSPQIQIPIAIGAILLIAIIIYLWRAVKKAQLKYQQLSEYEVALFLRGAEENIDMNLALDQQADLLPYCPAYEFPRENLKLGRQLGSGAFGMVLRGEVSLPLFGYTKDCPSQKSEPRGPRIVAVKMVKPNAELSHIKALMTELKILIHVGKHLNVVNLLGACTTNLRNKELFVIVEYCINGSLHTNLLRDRVIFLDQVNHLKDVFDFSIGMEDDEERPYENKNDDVEQTIVFKKETSTIMFDPRIELEIYDGDTSPLEECSMVHSQTEGCDFRAERKLKTKDLVCWSYQVAKGMQYLASRKIVHGDLAARNILLADHNVIKICDFGLARKLYSEANYLKKSDDPLPIKWMAIESIQDKIFSTETDVWTFGVVLWELFTLAKTPYPGIPVDENFLCKLIEGYRMEKPHYSTFQIYKIMRKCWEIDATNRPNFDELVNIMGQILDENTKKLYLILNEPYLKMNDLQKQCKNEFRASSEIITPQTERGSSYYDPSGSQV